MRETSFDRSDEEVGSSFVFHCGQFKNCNAAICQSCRTALHVVCEHLERGRIDKAPDLYSYSHSKQKEHLTVHSVISSEGFKAH